jgi:hypothetical protein
MMAAARGTGGAILARPTHLDDDRGITEGILRQNAQITPKETSASRHIALACSEPPKGRARWTLRVLENKGRGTEHRRSRQRQHDRADAQKNILKPHLKQQWVIPPEARKVGRDRIGISVDERTRPPTLEAVWRAFGGYNLVYRDEFPKYRLPAALPIEQGRLLSRHPPRKDSPRRRFRGKVKRCVR